MQKEILQQVLLLKKEKKEFAIVTDLQTSLNYIYQPGTVLSDKIQLEQKKLNTHFKLELMECLKEQNYLLKIIIDLFKL